MSFGNLNPQHAVLAVIDVQERLQKIMDPSIGRRVFANIGLAIEMANHWRMPILVTEQYPQGLGPTIEPLRNLLGDVARVPKDAFSCCGEPAFIEALQALDRRHAILVGQETHICVLQTAFDLLERGFEVYIADDAVQSSSKQRWRSGLAAMRAAGAVCLPIESLLYRMTGRSGTDDFKKLVSLIKKTNAVLAEAD